MKARSGRCRSECHPEGAGRISRATLRSIAERKERELRVLAVVGTSRKNGLVSRMCEKVLEGAADNGHETELINLYDYNIGWCTGCWACADTGQRAGIPDEGFWPSPPSAGKEIRNSCRNDGAVSRIARIG